MLIRRYLGRDSQEAMKKVKTSLGSNAIILNTRKIRKKGFKGLFSKPYVEILAAVDQDTSINKTNNMEIKNIDKNIESNKGKINFKKPETKTNEDNDIGKLKNKVNNMEQLINKIYVQMQTDNNETDISIPTKSKINNGDKKIENQSKIVQMFANNMINNNVNIEIVKEIIEKSKETINDYSNIYEVQSSLCETIIQMVGEPQPVDLYNNNKCRKAVFLGPTGVGKTTTLAKIAAMLSVKDKKNIGIISADTYRIAAVEQLKTYAKILDLPVEVVYSHEEIPHALKEFEDMDMVLVDTAGSSHKDYDLFEELKKILLVLNADELFLLISLTTDNNVCREIIKSYDFLEDYKLIFTKIDEAASSGIILNTKVSTNKKLSYITTGQSVPDDIMIADVDEIANSVLGSIRV